MKKLILMFVIFASIGLFASAQKLNESKVPPAVKSAFAKKFAGATAKWGKENAKEYEAEFTWNNKSASANFLTDGTWVETEAEINAADIPAAVKSAIEKKYPNASITKVFKIENSKGEQTYEAEIKTGNKKKEMILKADGAIMK